MKSVSATQIRHAKEKRKTEMSADKVIRHAVKANEILSSLHRLATHGKVDLTEDGKWPYDWVTLEVLLHHIPQMKTVEVCREVGSYDGCWIRQEVEIDVWNYGNEIRGILSVTRSGPALELIAWDFKPQSITVKV